MQSKEKRRLNWKKWYNRYPGYKRIRQKVSRIRWKLKIFHSLGMKCALCGESDLNTLQIDHVFGGGRKEIEECQHSAFYYYRQVLRKLKEGSKDYRLLCANCNWKEKRKLLGQMDLNEYEANPCSAYQIFKEQSGKDGK